MYYTTRAQVNNSDTISFLHMETFQIPSVSGAHGERQQNIRISLPVINGRRGPWPCEGSMPQHRGMPGPGSGNEWVGEQGGGGGHRGLLEGKL